ncbi:MMPL family transporter [Candidatus Parvarchaeota archaeon]|nr:MMPL family transporter [Candidatus Parvarchaeota archaeon]
MKRLRLEDKILSNNKKILLIWGIAFFIMLPFAIHLFSVVSYNVTNSQNSRTAAQKGNSTQILVITDKNILSNSSKSEILKIGSEFKKSSSIFSYEETIINSTRNIIDDYYPSILSSLYEFYNTNISSVSKQLNQTIINLTALKIRSILQNDTNHSIEIGKDFLSFASGVIRGYGNYSTDYIIYTENFSDYPVNVSSEIFNLLVNIHHNTTIMTLNDVNYSKAYPVVESISKGYNETVYFSGSQALQDQIKQETTTGTILALLFGIIAAIVITGFIFRSYLTAFVPITLFGADLVIAYGLFYLLYSLLHSKLSFFDPAITSILMLGLATDYFVYIMYRYRQERVYSKKDDAVRISMKNAGLAVLVSGLTVISAYAVLSLFNLAFIGSSAIINTIGISVVLLSALTLLPATMKTFGDRIVKPAHKNGFSFHTIFEKIAMFDLKNKKKILAIFFIFALVSGYIFISTKPGFDFLGLLSNSGAKSAFYVATGNFGYDVIDPLFVNVTNSSINPPLIASHISDLNNVYAVYYSKKNSTVTSFTVYLKNMAFTRAAINSYYGIKDYLSSAGLRYNAYGTQVFLGSALSSISGSVPPLLIILSIVIFTILFILLYSVFTPVRLVLLLLSIIMLANAFTVFLFYYVFSLPFMIISQVFLITTIMGVGVDYDIFMVMRIREHIKKGGTNAEAVKQGIIKSGPIIISLGLILSSVFFALLGSGQPLIGQVGLIIGVGIILDSVLSVIFIVPSLMLILDRYNWWPKKF